ncbi:MAG: hypothetical protein HYZ22_17145 [Chloroflexi bacterium]|nr:hypothetical protein [Chloroflexota bacterium]
MNIKHEEWQTYFTAEQARWKDSRGTFSLIASILAGTLFAVFFLILLIVENEPNSEPLQLFFQFAEILSTPVVPIVLVGIGIRLVYKHVLSFFNELYRPSDIALSSKLIRRRLFGVPPLPAPLNAIIHYPFVIASEGEIQGHDYTEWLGGPAILVIMDGTALYLERGNCFSRVVGPGVAFLEKYETIKDSVDLRPQTYTGKVEAWTKDGIKVSFIAKIICRIGNPNHSSISNVPVAVSLKADGKVAGENTPIFPCDPVCVRKAVEWIKIKKTPDSSGVLYQSKWLDGSWGKVQGVLSNYVSKRRLENLFVSLNHGDGGQILSAHERERLRSEISKDLLAEAGVTLAEIQIERFSIENSIHKKRIEKWAAEWQAKAKIHEAEANADGIKAKENARAEAQRDLIVQIAEGLSTANADTFKDSALLALSGLLEQNLGDPYASAYLNDAIEKIKEIINS